MLAPLTTQLNRIRSRFAHKAPMGVESPAIAEPSRDWGYLLMGSAALAVILCVWALYVGMRSPAAQDGPPQRSARLDREALVRVLSAFEERAQEHAALRSGGRAFVDPGR